MISKAFGIYLLFLVSFIFAGTVSDLSAQVKTKKRTGQRSASTTTRSAEPTPTPQTSQPSQKKNERPSSSAASEAVTDAKHTTAAAKYIYRFSHPDFVIRSIVITHDDTGAGEISFTKKDDEEVITDPLKVSQSALERIDQALSDLNFLDSTENYQYSKDYSHLGTMDFSFSSGGRSREISVNWTERKEAKVLMDEYRKLKNQYVWIFDVSLAKENQPLETPRLVANLDSLIRRNEVSDASQLVPFLTKLSNDESIPLIARNHAGRLVKEIEKKNSRKK